MNTIRRTKEWFTGALTRVPAISATAALIAASGVSGAYAQEGGLAIEEITVTAQKRAESSQDTPITISAFGEEFLKESNIVGVDKLVGYTPGLNGSTQRDTVGSFTVRGIGTYAFSVGVDNSVGMFIDDVPIARTSLIGSSFFDLERVEVVKGPQGTLFGRNASAGAISLITKKPDLDENSLELTIGAGNESQLVYEASGNLVASDKVGFRLAVRHDERDGHWKNTPTGDELNNRDHTNVRLSMRYDISDAVAADFSVEAIRIDTRAGTAPATQAFNKSVVQNQLPTQDIQSERFLAKFTWDINGSMTLTSNTSYLSYDMTVAPVDVDVSDTFVLNLLEPEEGTQFVQEFRLNGGTDRVNWFLGASFIDEELENHTTYQWDDFELGEVLGGPGFGDILCGALVCQSFNEQRHDATSDNNSAAIYGDFAWNISDLMKLTVGARYTRDEKDFLVNQPINTNSAISQFLGDAIILLGTNGPVTGGNDWTSFDPRVVLDYQLTDDALLYGSVSSGYKSGGFNSDVVNSLASGIPQALVSFDEEQVLAYELGLKTRFWDDRAQVNASVYLNDYDDFQVETSSIAGIFINNAATVESKGFEVEGTFLLSENFTFMANFSKLDATFKNTMIQGVDVSGVQLQRAPETSGAVVAIYEAPVGNLGYLLVRGDYLFTDDVSFDSLDPTLTQSSYGVFNARVALKAESDKWEIALIGENVGDEEYLVHMTNPLGVPLAVPAMRALYRVEATVRF